MIIIGGWKMEGKFIIKVMDEEGNKVELELIDTIVLDSQEYAILAQVEEEDDAYIYKVETIDGKKHYSYIEDDEEFERVSEAYEESFN